MSLLKLLGDGRRRPAGAYASRGRPGPVGPTPAELDPGRADHEHLRSRQEQILVSDLFAELRTRFQPRAARDGRLIAAERTGATSVFADRQRVTQAMSSLIENALDHGAGAICLLAEQIDGVTRLHVRDHGSGFPQQLLARVFDRPGLASGGDHSLSVVQAITDGLGGHAHATNAASGGAHVWLELPAHRAAV